VKDSVSVTLLRGVEGVHLMQPNPLWHQLRERAEKISGDKKHVEGFFHRVVALRSSIQHTKWPPERERCAALLFLPPKIKNLPTFAPINCRRIVGPRPSGRIEPLQAGFECCLAIKAIGFECTKRDRHPALLCGRIARKLRSRTRRIAMVNCPLCHGKRIHRSKRRGIFERRVLAMMFVRPYRCDLCDHRFFHRSVAAHPGAFWTAGTH
jgi:hypothetical protein